VKRFDLFIGWSGEVAQQCALLLEGWIKQLNHTIHPFCSDTGIEKGELARARIAEQLRVSDSGIVCVTRENQTAPWLNFEAGALSKAVSDSRVMPFLIDLREKELLSGPLKSFQATDSTDKEQVFRMVKTINGRCDSPVEAHNLRTHFDLYWGHLDAKLEKIRQLAPSRGTPARETPDLLNELLRLVREQNTRIAALEGRLAAAGRASSVTAPAPSAWTPSPNGAEEDAWNGKVAMSVGKIIGERHVHRMSIAKSGITVRCDNDGYQRATEDYGRLQALADSVGATIEVTDDTEILVFEPV
jgi:hypothetical protein